MTRGRPAKQLDSEAAPMTSEEQQPRSRRPDQQALPATSTIFPRHRRRHAECM